MAHRQQADWLQQPRAEPLERRVQLSGNIALTGMSLSDVNGNTLLNFAPGQFVYVHVTYTTQGLGGSDAYKLSLTLNGTTNYFTSSNGDGVSGTGNYFYTSYGFKASPGGNVFSASFNYDKAVTETSYNDDASTATLYAHLTRTDYLSYSAAQMRSAYGISSLPAFGTQAADGTGQTIAIIDAYDSPNIYSDLDGFDRAMSISTSNTATLAQLYPASSSFLSVYNQSGVDISSSVTNSGTGNVPTIDPADVKNPGSGWEGETTLDVEWAHAIAPGAHIDLVETKGNLSGDNYLGLFSGVATARTLANVSVVSMSWTFSEGNWSDNGATERNYDTTLFTTPAGHTGETFFTGIGDGGTPGGYPGYSPNVVAVGGTELLTNDNAYSSETGWSYPTPRTIGYGASGYTQSGTWNTQSVGLDGTSARAPTGGSSTATWSIPFTASDRGWLNGIELSTTWTANLFNASNAVYSIYNGTVSSANFLGSVTVDQTKNPAGVLAAAIGSGQSELMQSLGVYYPSGTSGTLTVVLNSSGANGAVDADAVGIAKSFASAGGTSRTEAEPTYQSGSQSTGYRTIPDVSMDASVNSGVTVYLNGALNLGSFGTSLASPMWAGLMAIVDQGRVAAGTAVFDSSSNPTQALTALYKLPAADFHDITTGYNGFTAGSGYDQVTGRGTPIAPLVVRDLVNFGVAPTVTAATYNYAAAAPAIELTFNGNVAGSISSSPFSLVNLTSGATVSSGNLALSTLSNGDFLLSYTGAAHGVLPDGNYRLTLPSGSVRNATGDVQSSLYSFDFFVLAGDANRDRIVDGNDLAILNTYTGSGGTFAQGDFNYDGVVNDSDLAIYNAQRFIEVPPQGPLYLGLLPFANNDTYTIKRESDTLLDLNYSSEHLVRVYIGTITGSLSYNARSGNDTLTLDFSNGPLVNPGVTISADGSTGTDTLNIVGTTAADNVSFSSGGVVINGTTVSFANFETVNFDGLGGGDTLANSGANVTLNNAQQLANLSLASGTTMSIAPNTSAPIVVNSLSIAAGAKLDLSNNTLIVDYTGSSPASTLRGYLSSGRNGGTWNGTSGITSSAVAGVANSALGYAEASSILGPNGGTFAGQTVDGTALIVRFTLIGDVNLDRKVDIGDLGLLAQNWQKTNAVWSQGDFDYSGLVDIGDLGLLSQDWQRSYAPPAAAAVAIKTPIQKAAVFH